MKKLFIISLITLTLIGLVYFRAVFSQTCPSNTQVSQTSAVLVGEIIDDGGDPNLEVWFEYGRTTAFGLETEHKQKFGTGLFCVTVEGLEPGTRYFYRAVSKNSAGTSAGQTHSFTTPNLVVSVDIKANGSDGLITIYHNGIAKLSWNSQNAASCEADGDWSGTKMVSGSQSLQFNSVKTFTFIITCRDASGAQTAVDSVQIKVVPRLPVVVTRPAVVTF